MEATKSRAWLGDAQALSGLNLRALQADKGTMSIDVSIEHNFDQLEGFLDDLKTKAAIESTRFSINRTLLTVRERSVEKIRQRLNIKVSDLKGGGKGKKQGQLKMRKARGGSLHTMEGSLLYNSNAIPLLKFITGSKQPRNQKGIPVAKRKRLKARIRPGKTIKLRHAFIADVHSKQVFKRISSDSRKVKKQGITSVGFIFNKAPFRKEIQMLSGRRFTELFEREYKRRVFNAAKRRNARSRSRR